MTRTPTDRGYAFIKNNVDGTKNVYVAVGFSGTEPTDVVAMHLSRPGVNLAAGVGTVAAGSMVRTTRPVHVTSGDDNIVQIRGARADRGMLFDNPSGDADAALRTS
jgi:hypothetical protein